MTSMQESHTEAYEELDTLNIGNELEGLKVSLDSRVNYRERWMANHFLKNPG